MYNNTLYGHILLAMEFDTLVCWRLLARPLSIDFISATPSCLCQAHQVNDEEQLCDTWRTVCLVDSLMMMN